MSAIAKLIRADGTITPIAPANGRHFTLAEMQSAVGGYIQIIECPGEHRAVLVLNEEGKLLGLDPNLVASTLLAEAGGIPGDFIVGDAVLMPGHLLD